MGYYRGYIARKKVEEIREEEMEFLGMKKEVPLEIPADSDKAKVLKIREKQKLTQKEHENELKKEQSRIKEFIITNEGPEIKEKLLAERRKWIIQHYENTEGRELPKKIDDFYDRNNVAQPLSDADAEAK